MLSMNQSLAALAATLSLTGAAHADVLYTSSGYATIASPSVNAWCSSCDGSYVVLNPFSLAGASVVTGAEAAAQADWGSDWNITVQVWDSTQTHVLDSATFANGSYGLASVGGDVDDLTFALPSWKLAAGNYFVSFYDPANLAVPGYATGGDSQFQNDSRSGTSDALGTAGAYRLTGVPAVPETSGLALMLAGLALVGVAARRRRQA